MEFLPNINELRQHMNKSSWNQAIGSFVSNLEEALHQLGNPEDSSAELASRFLCRFGPLAAELMLSQPEAPRPCPFLEVFRRSDNDRNKLMFDDGSVAKLLGSIGESFQTDRHCDWNADVTRIRPAAESLLGRLYTQTGLRIRGLELRCATLQCLQHAMERTIGETQLPTFVSKLIDDYRSFFSTRSLSVGYETLHRSVDWKLLHGGGGVAQSLANAIDEAVVQRGWSYRDPAVAFVIATLAEATDDRRVATERIDKWIAGDTWLMVGSRDYQNTGSTGIVKKLRVTKRFQTDLSPLNVQDLCATVLYPDPRFQAYVGITESFQQGIWNAMLSVLDVHLNHDFRYQTVCYDPSDSKEFELWKDSPDALFDSNKEPWPSDKSWQSQIPHRTRHVLPFEYVDGDSATLGFALALKSCKLNEPLRSDVASTAAFEVGRSGAPDTNPLLRVVGLVSEKDRAMDEVTTSTSGDSSLTSYGIDWHSSDPSFGIWLKDVLVTKEQTWRFPVSLKPIPKLHFEDAWNYASEFGRKIAQHADLVAKHWSIASRPEQDERLDLFIWPQLKWETEDPDARNETARWLQTPVEGIDDFFLEPMHIDERQLATVFGQMHKDRKFLVVHDGAGAGKTALSLQIEHHATHENLFESLFPDGRRRLVVRWEKQLPVTQTLFPQTQFAKPTIEQLLTADAELASVVEEVGERVELVKYALKQGLVVVIVDGYDEFVESDRAILRHFFDETNKNFEETQIQHVMWIVLGRPHSIDSDRARYRKQHRWLQDRYFLRLRVSLFDKTRQDDYFQMALRSANLPREHWRQMMPELSGNEQQEIVGLPHTLREIFRLVEEHYLQTNSYDNLPTFSSLSDLFLQTSIPLLRRTLEKRTEDEQRTDSLRPGDVEEHLEILERALSCIACEMAVNGLFVKTIPSSNESNIDCVRRIKTNAFKRFERIGNEVDPTSDQSADWNWAYVRLRKSFLNYFTADQSPGSSCLAFRNRRVLENYVARFLTYYAHRDDLESSAELTPRPALRCIGDPEWHLIWRWVIETPVKINLKAFGADLAKYKSAIQLLFQRPIEADQRRPTHSMWLADLWIKKAVMNGRKELDGFDEDLRKDLGEQFKRASSKISAEGTLEQKKALEELMDLNNFVVLADPCKPVDKFDTGEFKMGRVKGVKVTLSKFGICKYAVANEQFKIFDNNFILQEYERSSGYDDGSEEEEYFMTNIWDEQDEAIIQEYLRQKSLKMQAILEKMFGNPRQPAIFVNWYDCFWFSQFLSNGYILDNERQSWRIVLPYEAQFEYASRAGSDGDFFRGNSASGKIEVDRTTLKAYSHFGQRGQTEQKTIEVDDKRVLPNAWNLYLTGNIWKWMLDSYQYRLEGGHDPVINVSDVSDRVIRGGSFSDYATYCESSNSYKDHALNRKIHQGMVLALCPLEIKEGQ